MTVSHAILTENAPAPVGPYSQAIEVRHSDHPSCGFNMIFCSGQIALDPKNGNMVGITAAAQTLQVMENIKNVLAAAGSSFRDVVKTTIFMTDLKSFADVNEVYQAVLEGHKPARSTVEVSALPKGALIEIECIAIRS